MKNGNWIALHKELCYFLPHDRPYTLLEAMFSYTLDVDKGKEGTISGYSKQWGWSRCKVRRFVTELKTGTRQVSDRDKTGARHHISLKLNNLQEVKDTFKTPLRQEQDSHLDTTIYPKPKPKPKPIKTFLLDSIEYQLSELLLNEILKRNPEHKANLQNWSKDIDKMIRLDNRKQDVIKQVVQWSQKDPFWQNNILSTGSLRKQYDKLLIKMNGSGKGQVESKHTGLNKKDYREGVNEDGSF